MSHRRHLTRLAELFSKYQLRAKKRLDFEIWRDAVATFNSMPRTKRVGHHPDHAKILALRECLISGREFKDPRV